MYDFTFVGKASHTVWNEQNHELVEQLHLEASQNGKLPFSKQVCILMNMIKGHYTHYFNVLALLRSLLKDR